MSGENIIVLSNAMETSNNYVVYPLRASVVLEDDFASPSYITYISLNKREGFVGLDTNKVIDLMKIENLNKIRKMAAFGPDWNGTGGSAFSQEAINLFREIIEALVKQPQIAPTGRNSLLLQYELDDKSLLAFEVGENKTEKVYIPKGDYSLAETEVFTEDIVRQIGRNVERFYGFG